MKKHKYVWTCVWCFFMRRPAASKSKQLMSMLFSPKSHESLLSVTLATKVYKDWLRPNPLLLSQADDLLFLYCYRCCCCSAKCLLSIVLFLQLFEDRQWCLMPKVILCYFQTRKENAHCTCIWMLSPMVGRIQKIPSGKWVFCYCCC